MTSIDPYVLQQASCRASLLVRTAGFPVHEFDDLFQELLLDLLLRSCKFNPARGEWPAFVRGVTRHQASVLFKRRNRRAQWEILASDLLAGDGSEDDGENLLEDLLPGDGTDALLFSIDVRRVLGELPPQLQLLAGLLIEVPVGEIPLTIGKSRSRVHQLIRKLREAFASAGLEPRVIRSRRPTG
jgi:hypothetical protein